MNHTNETEHDAGIAFYLSVARYLWMVISPPLFIFGMLGGGSIILVLTKMKCWRPTKFAMLAVFVLAIADMIVLCVGLSRYWVIETFHFDLRIISNFGCQLNLFVIYSSMQYSSWILVFITFERFFLTNYTFKYMTFMTRKKVVVFLSILLIILATFNCHFFVTHGVVSSESEKQCDISKESYKTFDDIYTTADFLILSLIPFIAMTIFNVFIRRSLKSSNKFRKQSTVSTGNQGLLSTADRRITRMMMLTSFYFLVTTVPISVMFILNAYIDEVDDLTKAKVKVVVSVVYLIQYSNYAMNAVFYLVLNIRFRKVFLNLCCPRTSR